MASQPLIGSLHSRSSRYELKYFAGPATIERLRAEIAPWAQPDQYARHRTGHRYLVDSQYFDSPDLTLYRATVGGHKSRFKLRLRSYDDGSDSVFAEIKRRVNDVIVKTRSRVSATVAEQIEEWTLGGPRPHLQSGGGLESFVQALSLLEARPAVRVRYQREAYETVTPPIVRVTFDFDLAYSISHGWGHAAIEPAWHHVPVEGAVVEIKFNDVFPAWLADLVHTLELRRQPIPKYALAVSDAGAHHARWLGSGSVGLPFLASTLPRIS
ncbi:MAG: polyphosphate polymerase domain-containing protein [Deltaproteobacteria bacterium]|nr:MAG: polyphosphate polymerase domain-containing protein [Deltaproteobacteria bacterium]